MSEEMKLKLFKEIVKVSKMGLEGEETGLVRAIVIMGVEDEFTEWLTPDKFDEEY